MKDAGREYTYFLADDFIQKIDSVLSRKPGGIKNKCNVDEIYSMEGRRRIFGAFNHEDSIYFTLLSRNISKIDTVRLINLLNEVVLKNGIDSQFTINLMDYNGTEKAKDGNYYQAIIAIPGLVDKYYLLQVNFTEMDTLILKKTLPLFSLIILFTGLLFFIYYRTLGIFKKQKTDLESKNHFINNMTHELKTPISAIQLAADSLLISNDFSASNVKKYLSIVYSQGSKLNTLVQKVLDTARAERNEFELTLESISINEIIRQSIEKLKVKIESANANLKFATDSKGATVLVDAFYMESVFVNLIDNSIKYSGNKPDIEIQSIEQDGMAVVTIKDKGIGISKENQKKVFRKFFRVEGTDTHNIKGHGLGLTLVKEIVQLHNGNIKLRSKLNYGTSVELKIPLLDEYDSSGRGR
ncbi:MAG: HAMP domain-containing histidine kinase [Bacteroidetes bacterium]|nr:HAMP domain-containing histidine kinase [Bacteroidota bacterium]